MSCYLAVWAGERPASDAEALEVFNQLLALSNQDPAPEPAQAIKDYVAALLAKWPDIPEDDWEDSPWSNGPLLDSAAGNWIFFGIAWSMVEETVPFVVETARQMGLVCFDLQSEALIPPED